VSNKYLSRWDMHVSVAPVIVTTVTTVQHVKSIIKVTAMKRDLVLVIRYDTNQTSAKTISEQIENFVGVENVT
jgi:hypothetical protein